MRQTSQTVHLTRTRTVLTLLAAASTWTSTIVVAQIPPPTDAPQPLTPEQTAASYRLPDGFRFEVIASEPLIASPSGVCWDEHGQMFVSELHGYNLAGQLDIEELNKTGQLDTQVRRVRADEKFQRAAQRGTYGVIKRLRDTDGDGRMDAADVWATNLPPAYGLAPARGGIIVACAPDILFLADRDVDGHAETRETLFTGFPTGELERGVNAPQWGDDGWIYFGRGWGGGKITGAHLREPVQLPGADFRIRADGTAIEPVTGATGTFGFALTDEGDRFVVDTTTSFYVAPLPWRYLKRNPDVAAADLAAATGDRRAYARSQPHPWRTRRAEHADYFKYYRDRYGASDSDAGGWFTAKCGPLVYRDKVLPGLHGHFFVCEAAGNLIHRAILRANGSVLELDRAPGEEQSEFAASTDAWSHPMNLLHGPDGSIWVVDFYREIIEDYSAIPRHLQQQYGLYAGHDRGRIYRLTHRDTVHPDAIDMSRLDRTALARECGSPLLWRRQTAQRLLVERGETNAAPMLREQLIARNDEPHGITCSLRTLDQLGALAPADVQPFLLHPNAAVRAHALQLGDRWFAREQGGPLLEETLIAAAAETDPRVLLQFALSLGESRDPRAFAVLVRFASEHASLRWMDTAILSSVHGRAVDLLAELVPNPDASWPVLRPLAQSIGAGRNESDLSRTLGLITDTPPDTQALLLGAMASGRENVPRRPLRDASAQRSLAALNASASEPVRVAARRLADTLVVTAVDDAAWLPAGTLPIVEPVSDQTFRSYLAALPGPRDLGRGHELFLEACATCHRIGDEGHDVGPDLMGQIGLGEESLLREILMPNERIRPDYETTLVRMIDGAVVLGILKDDGATSLTLSLPGGIEQIVLRKDVTAVRRLGSSLMPSFAEGLPPADVAHVLGWLRAQHQGTPNPEPAR